MNSPAKLLRFLEGFADLEDAELSKAVAFASPRVVRGALAAAARAVPLDAELLDNYIAQTVELMLALRSDHILEAAAAAELAAGAQAEDDVDHQVEATS